MPVRKVVDPQKISNSPIIESSSQPEQVKSTQPGAGTRSAFAGLRGLFDTPTRAINSLFEAIGEPKPAKQGTLYDQILQQSGYDPKQLASQSTTENIVHRFAENAPLNLALGGGLPGALSTLGGATAGTAAKNIGFGEQGQNIADLLGNLLTGKGIRSIPTLGEPSHAVSGGIPRIYKQQQDITHKAYESGKQTNNIEPYLDIAGSLLNKVSNAGSKATKTILKQAEGIINSIRGKGGETNFLEALEARRTLDSLIPKATPQARNVLKSMRDGLQDFLKYNNPANPAYAKSLSREDQIYAVGQLAKTSEEFVSKWRKGQYSKFIPAPISRALGKGAEIISHFSVLAKNDPVTLMKYLYNSAEAAAKNNFSAFGNALVQMEKVAGKEKPTKEIKKGKVYKVLK